MRKDNQHITSQIMQIYIREGKASTLNLRSAYIVLSKQCSVISMSLEMKKILIMHIMLDFKNEFYYCAVGLYRGISGAAK